MQGKGDFELSACYDSLLYFFFFFKQKTAYEIRNCDWSSDVCSSDLLVFECALSRTVRLTESGAFRFSVDAFTPVADGGEIGRASCRERV